MILHSLTTRGFRNLAPERVEFHERANIVVGRNGQGKTNLLEAIYFLATTKSFRTAKVASLFRFDESNLFVSGAVERDRLQRTLSAGLEWGETKRRVLMVNEEKVTLPAYLNALAVFAYSSARLDVVRGVPEDRRRFLDRGIASLHPDYLEQLSRYLRVLRQRNALLQEIATNRESPATLGAWDDELTSTAAVVQAARRSYTDELQTLFDETVEAHGYHVRGVRIGYAPNEVAGLENLRRAETRARTSLVGPQRDLVDFTIDGRTASEVLSGGEQKMVVLFLKFAKLELFRRRHDDAAVFVLDDVDAELDLVVLEALLQRLPESTQVFASSAKESFLQVLESGPHRRLSLLSGRVTSHRDFA